MELIKLIIIFLCIISFISLKKSLFFSILSGFLLGIILYQVPLIYSMKLVIKACISKETISLILSFYTITYVQRMMEERKHLLLAEKSLSNIFNSQKINIMLAPFIIGLLPSAGAVLIAAPIVKNASENYLDIKEQAFVTSYFRHISEAFLPTYSSILLALELSKIDMTIFVLGMLPMVFILFILGYIFYVKKIPKSNIINKNLINKKEEVRNLIISLWPIATTIIIILTLKIQPYLAVIPVIFISILINKFTLKELLPLFKSAFEIKLILNTIMIMIFKELLVHIGIIKKLPEYFEILPIPPIAIFSLIFFFGTLIAGSQAIIVLGLPLAFASIPNGGLALMILLMCITYISMQISPTHICLAIVTEAFNISLIDLVKKTFPIVFIFLLITVLYSYIIFILQ